MKKILKEAKKGGRVLRPGAPGGVRSSGYIDPSNIDERPDRSKLPSDRGIRDQMRLHNLFKTSLKVIHRQGKGEELDSFIEKGLKSLFRLQSAARIISDPKRYRDYDQKIYRQDAEESKGEILALYNTAEEFLSKLIAQSVSKAYMKASDEDKKKILNLKSFDELPENFDNITADEAELISEIFFKGSTRVTKEEAIEKVKQIVLSFIKLDKEVMEDESTVHNMLTRLKTASKTANIEKDNLVKRKKAPMVDPSAGYKQRGVDIAVKRRLTKALSSGDDVEARAILSTNGRDDLAKLVGKKSEASITRSFILGTPFTESFVFEYDLLVSNILRSSRSK